MCVERERERMREIVQLFKELIFHCLWPWGQEEPRSWKGIPPGLIFVQGGRGG